MSQAIKYISLNSNHTFDFNYQKASLLDLLEALKRNDSISAKLKKKLIEKACQTLGLNRLPDSDRVTPFFHCSEGEFFVTFLYNSDTTSTPWEMIVANNFGELIPLFLEIYSELKKPIFNSSSATIGNFSVFHHQNALPFPKMHQFLELKEKENSENTSNEELSCNEWNKLEETQKKLNKRNKNKVMSYKKSTTSAKKGLKNSIVAETIQMSTSMPNLDNTMFTHRYATRRRKNSSMLSTN